MRLSICCCSTSSKTPLAVLQHSSPAPAWAPRGAQRQARGRACQAKRKGSPEPAATAAPPEEAISLPPPGPSSTPAPAPTVVREWTALGGRVVETDERLPGPEDEVDFWDNEQYEAFGKAMQSYFVPALVVLGLVCGAYATQSYNEGATVYVKSATSDDTTALFIPAAVVDGASVSVSSPSVAGE